MLNTSTKTSEKTNGNLFSFITNATIELSRIESSRELDVFLDLFFTADARNIIASNQREMLLFSMILTANIRRVVFKSGTVIFPNKLLILPPLFQQTGWSFVGNKEWDHAIETAERYFNRQANCSDAIVLLFLEGMKFGVERAIHQYEYRIDQCSLRPCEVITARNLMTELGDYGWRVRTDKQSEIVH